MRTRAARTAVRIDSISHSRLDRVFCGPQPRRSDRQEDALSKPRLPLGHLTAGAQYMMGGLAADGTQPSHLADCVDGRTHRKFGSGAVQGKASNADGETVRTSREGWSDSYETQRISHRDGGRRRSGRTRFRRRARHRPRRLDRRRRRARVRAEAVAAVAEAGRQMYRRRSSRASRS